MNEKDNATVFLKNFKGLRYRGEHGDHYEIILNKCDLSLLMLD